MALFSMVIRCEGIGESVSQYEAGSPYRAVAALLKSSVLRDMTAKHPEWPTDFALRDIYAFIPLAGLSGSFFCGLGAKGKYVGISIFHTAQRSKQADRYCGPQRKTVVLR